jgi:hypothetical protein
MSNTFKGHGFTSAMEMHERLLELDNTVIPTEERAESIISRILLAIASADNAPIETTVDRIKKGDLSSPVFSFNAYLAGIHMLSITRQPDDSFLTKVNKTMVNELKLYLQSESLGPLPFSILNQLNRDEENVDAVTRFIKEMTNAKNNNYEELRNIEIDHVKGSYFIARNTVMDRVIFRVLCSSPKKWEVTNE